MTSLNAITTACFSADVKQQNQVESLFAGCEMYDGLFFAIIQNAKIGLHQISYDARVLIQHLKQVAYDRLWTESQHPSLVLFDEFTSLGDAVQLVDLMLQAREAQIAVVVSTQHSDKVDNTELREGVIAIVVRPVLADAGLEAAERDILVNPTGRFVVGGPQGDAGLTGRKIIVDSYGGMARHGGGAFSGKDPSKVDRSGAYAMRWVAKNVVAAKLAQRCEPDEVIEDAVREVFDLTPLGIIKALRLCNPIYRATAAYGHFGRPSEKRRFVDKDVDKEVELFTWEHANRVEDLRLAAQGSHRYGPAQAIA